MKTFLSYPSENLDLAREVYDFVRTLGVQIWFDKESLIAGQNWDRERATAQKSADLIILICSSETINKSGVIQREIKDALDLLRDKPLSHIFLVSLRTEEFILPQELTGYQYIDLFRAGWQLKLARSIHFRLEQLEVPVPKGLRAFMEAQESEGGIQPKTLRFEGKNFDAQADYFVYRRGGLFWDYINAEITADAVRGFFKASAEGPIFLEGQVRSGGWSLRVEEHYNQGDLVSLKFFEWAVCILTTEFIQ